MRQETDRLAAVMKFLLVAGNLLHTIASVSIRYIAGRLGWGPAARTAGDAEACEGSAGETPPLIAFSFAGMLWAYFIGVVAFFKDHFDLGASEVRLSGISCGTSAAMAIFLELSIEQSFELGLGWQTLFNSRPLKFWLIGTGSVMSMLMAKFRSFGLTDTALQAKYATYPGIYFGVTSFETRATAGGIPIPQVSHRCLEGFGGFKEMIYAGTCSMRTLPFFRTPGRFRGTWCIDGALTACYAVPEAYSGEPDRVIRVGILNMPFDEEADISPEGNFEFAWHEWCNSGDLEANLIRFGKGYRDAAKLRSVASCIRKGLKWVWRCDTDAAEAGGVLPCDGSACHRGPTEHVIDASGKAVCADVWERHIESRLSFWGKQLRTHFSS